MLYLVAVIPLIPGQVMELNEETTGPFLARLANAFLIVEALLELSPRLGEKAFEQVLPANGGLGGNNAVDVGFGEVGKRESMMSPSMKTGEEGVLEAGVGVVFQEVGSELGYAVIPNITSSLGSATKDVGGVFRSTAAGALVVVLVLPFNKSFAHATFRRYMLRNPTPAGRL